MENVDFYKEASCAQICLCMLQIQIEIIYEKSKFTDKCRECEPGSKNLKDLVLFTSALNDSMTQKLEKRFKTFYKAWIGKKGLESLAIKDVQNEFKRFNIK